MGTVFGVAGVAVAEIVRNPLPDTGNVVWDAIVAVTTGPKLRGDSCKGSFFKFPREFPMEVVPNWFP